MLTEKEMKFIENWEQVRVEYSSFKSKMIRGLPMAMIFSFPILFSLAAVYFLSPEWYTKVSQKASGSISPIIISVLFCVPFFSFFRMHFKWEMNEQLYQELKNKKSIKKTTDS
jgi:hypothetical protein